jgi:hypothetical protein
MQGIKKYFIEIFTWVFQHILHKQKKIESSF